MAKEAFEQMRLDHHRVLERAAAVETAVLGGGVRPMGPATERELREALAVFESHFRGHVTAEDEVLFPALVRTLPETRRSVEPLESEHADLRDMLARLAATLAEPARPDRDEQIGVQLRDFIDLLRIHIRKEEALVMRVAEQVLPPREVQVLSARMSQIPRT